MCAGIHGFSVLLKDTKTKWMSADKCAELGFILYLLLITLAASFVPL